MNKKVLVSLAAAAAISFTSLGAVSADAACNNNKQDSQYTKYLQIQCLKKEDMENLKETLGDLTKLPSFNTNCTTPGVDSSGTENTTPEADSPVTDNTTPETDSSGSESTTPEVDANSPGTEITDPSTDKENTSTSTEVSAFEQEVLELTNAERTKAGLAPLTLDTELSKVARIKSQDMKDQNYFSHTSPTYGSPFDMMKTFGISYTSAAENIAQGQTTPKEVVQAWMNSQGHRENILNASYTHIGIGHVSDGNYWTQMFIGK